MTILNTGFLDIQEIPYHDAAFNVVIANMMLYHVPDIDKGLAEVRRVLRKDGHFYCATYGEHGIIEYLSKILFALKYIDSLAVTNIDDMMDYIHSLSGMASLSSVPRQEIRDILKNNTTDYLKCTKGVWNVYRAIENRKR